MPTYRKKDNTTSAKQAAKLNIKSIEEQQNALSPDIVDQIFEEFDDYTEEMISKWRENAVWSNNDETRSYLRLKRAAKRKAVLDRVAPDRVCPECKNIEYNDSNWRVNRWHSEVICGDCWRSNHTYRTISSQFYPGYDEWEILQLMHNIFVTPQVRYFINGKNLEKMRGILGVTRTTMSTVLGVTPIVITSWEEGAIKTMSRGRVVKCLQLFRGYFLRRLEELGYHDLAEIHKTSKYHVKVDDV